MTFYYLVPQSFPALSRCVALSLVFGFDIEYEAGKSAVIDVWSGLKNGKSQLGTLHPLAFLLCDKAIEQIKVNFLFFFAQNSKWSFAENRSHLVGADPPFLFWRG